MNQRTYKGSWRNTKAEAKFRERETAAWNRATTSLPEAIDVATSFGSTRAYRWPGTGTPLVFLHGMGDTSRRWVPFAEALEGHDVYAIDIMGDAGRSTPDVGFTSAADYADWFGEAIDELGLTLPHVVGHSLGGYIATLYAMRDDRVTSTVAFDPVGVVKLRLARFIAWGFGAALGHYAPGPIKRKVAVRLRHPLILDKEDMALSIQSQRDHPPKMPPLPVFTDEQLASITAPFRLVVGAESTAFDVKAMVERITTLVPNSQAQLIDDAGHALTMTHFDDCVIAIRDALSANVG